MGTEWLFVKHVKWQDVMALDIEKKFIDGSTADFEPIISPVPTDVARFSAVDALGKRWYTWAHRTKKDGIIFTEANSNQEDANPIKDAIRNAIGCDLVSYIGNVNSYEVWPDIPVDYRKRFQEEYPGFF